MSKYFENKVWRRKGKIQTNMQGHRVIMERGV
jgi:hypothetical protein